MGQFEAKLNCFREGLRMNPQWTDLPTITILDIYQEVLKEWRGGHQVNGQIAFARAIEANIKGVKHSMTRPIGISVPHRKVEDDDDIQDYKKPWVGLTDKEIDAGLLRTNYSMQTAGAWRDGVEWAMKQLKEKNNA